MLAEGILAFLRSSAALFVGKTAFFGVRILALLAMARMGTQEVFTCISYAVALGELGRLVADYGTETWSVRAIAISENPLEKARVVSSALILKAMFGIVAGLLICAVCARKFGHIGFVAGMLAGLQVLTTQAAGLTIAYLQAENQLQRLKILAAPCVLTAVAVCAALWVTGDSLLALAVLCAGELVASSLLLDVLRQSSMLTGGSPFGVGVRKMLVDCAPVALLSAVAGLYTRMDTLIVAQIALPSLAAYTVANRLFQPFQLGIMTLGATVYSRAAATLGKQGASLQPFLQQYLPLIVLTSVAAGALLFVGGSVLVTTLLPAYRAALVPLGIFSVTVVITALSSTAVGILWAYGRFATVTRIVVLQAGGALVTLLILVPWQGATGAAAGMLVAEVITAAIQWKYAVGVSSSGSRAAATL